jgi:hypothetical protein
MPAISRSNTPDWLKLLAAVYGNQDPLNGTGKKCIGGFPAVLMVTNINDFNSAT